MLCRPWLLLSLAASLTATVAHASYPAGVWVKVQKVAFEPDTASPARIRIYGAVLLYKGGTGGIAYLDTYTAPALGYLYYSCPSGDAATCFSEWQDVQANINAPADKCVGLGDQSLPTGTLRATSAAPMSPDPYPIAMGVLEGFTPCQALAEFLKTRPDGGTSSGGANNGGGANNSGATGAGGMNGGTGGAGNGGQTAPAAAGAGGKGNGGGAPSQGSGGRKGSAGTTTGDGGRTAPANDETGGASEASNVPATSNGGATEAMPAARRSAESPAPASNGCNLEPKTTSLGSAWAIVAAAAWAWRRRNRTA